MSDEMYGSTSGPIPTEDEMKGKYIGVSGIDMSVNMVNNPANILKGGILDDTFNHKQTDTELGNEYPNGQLFSHGRMENKMELTNDQYVTIGRIAEGAIESEEKICGYAHMPKSGNGYGNIGKFVYDQVYRIILAEQDKQRKLIHIFDPSLGGALSGRTFTVEQANEIIAYVKTAAHGYVEDRKCPHYQVRFHSQQNYNSQTGKPDHKPAGWSCAWCEQPFGLLPSLDPLYESIDSEILESVLKKGKDRDDKNI